MNSQTLFNVLVISFLGFEQGSVNIVSGGNDSSVHSTTTAFGANLSSTTKGPDAKAVNSNSTILNTAGLPTRTFTITKIKSTESVSSFSKFSSSVPVKMSSQSSPLLTSSVGELQTATSDYRSTSLVLLPSTSVLPSPLSSSVSLYLSSSLTPSLSSFLSRSDYSTSASAFGRLFSVSSHSSSFVLSLSSSFFPTPPYSSTSSTAFPSSSFPSFFSSSAFLDSNNSLYSSSSSFVLSLSSSFFSTPPYSSTSSTFIPISSSPSFFSSSAFLDLYSSSSSFMPSSSIFYSPSSSSDSSSSLSIFPSASVSSTNSSLVLDNSPYSLSVSVNSTSSYSSLSTNISQSMLMPSLVLTTQSVSQSMSLQLTTTSQLKSSLSSVFFTTVSSPLSSFPRQSSTPNIPLSSSTIFTALLASQTDVSKTQSSSLYMASETTSFTSLLKSVPSIVSSSRYTATMPSPSRGNIPTVTPMSLEFKGRIIVSVKQPSKLRIYDFKGISDSIERTLDDAFKLLQGYLYSKVLKITQKKHRRIECYFRVFMKGPSQVTSNDLKERLNNYNSTKGFDEFTLHSVETSVAKRSPDKDELKLWTIIVMVVLGVLCLLLAVLLLCLLRRIKKLKATKDLAKHQDDNGNKEYQHYTTLFHGADETQNIPLKLTKPRLSGTDSKKPLKSDTTCTDSEGEGSLSENGELRKMSEPSCSSGGDENENKDEKTSVQELQINEVTEEDESKFSTFSRKPVKNVSVETSTV